MHGQQNVKLHILRAMSNTKMRFIPVYRVSVLKIGINFICRLPSIPNTASQSVCCDTHEPSYTVVCRVTTLRSKTDLIYDGGKNFWKL